MVNFGPDFINFSDSWILVNFEIVGPKMGPKGPGRASIGSRDRFRFIWTKFQPKWAHPGPNGALFIFEFPKNPSWAQIAPVQSWSRAHKGPGPHPTWVLGPMEAEGRLIGGVWGGGAPPLQRGGSGRAAAPPEKNEPWSYCE